MYPDQLPDGTYLEFKLVHSKLCVDATATAESLAKLGEQLAWLGAALNIPRDQLGLALCTPSVKVLKTEAFALKTSKAINILISFSHQKANTTSVSTGTCWHKMFKSAVVVDGFPRKERKNNEAGLDLSLEMMIALGAAPYATEWDGTLVLKGFSTMFVATQHHEESIVWHFMSNPEKKHISYDAIEKDCPKSPSAGVPLELLDNSETRHFVGWVSSVTRHLG